MHGLILTLSLLSQIAPLNPPAPVPTDTPPVLITHTPPRKPCRPATAIVGENTWGSVVAFLAAPGLADYVYLWNPTAHESGEVMHNAQCIGRYARVCVESSHSGCPITIIGGMHPRDYGMAVAVEGFTSEASKEGREIGGSRHSHARRPERLAEALVRVGLASEGYATREAAHRALGGLGLDALPAIHAGLKSKDAEVKSRCEILMGQLLRGPEPEIEPKHVEIERDQKDENPNPADPLDQRPN